MEESRRERNKRLCRKRILKVSRRLFSAKGYEQTTIEDVAEMAEISKATLYNYFTSKESLLLGIAEAELADIRALLEGELRDEEDSVKKLRAALGTLVLDSMTYLPLSRKITCLNSNENSEMFHTRRELLNILEGLIQEGQAKGRIRPEVPVEELLELLMGVYLVSQFHWTKLSTYSPEECLQKLNRLFDRALEGLVVED